MSDAKALLASRLAKGEISIEEYKAVLATIEGGKSQTTASEQIMSAISQAATAPETKSRLRRIDEAVLGVIGIVVVGRILVGLFSGPVCEFSNLAVEPEAFLINGQLDAGYVAKVDVKNKGDRRNLTLGAVLMTSEGDFRRNQLLLFEAGATRTVSFQFPEPTISATNVRAEVSCQR
jgi:hypothetical protein